MNEMLKTEYMTIEKLIPAIVQWGRDRGLSDIDNRFAQFTKLSEEDGELAKSYKLQNRILQIDGVGDTFVTLIILLDQIGANPTNLFLSAEKIFESTEVDYNISVYERYFYFSIEKGMMAKTMFKGSLIERQHAIKNTIIQTMILSTHLGFKYVDCLNAAYQEIKDREGKTVDGSFIKN